VEWYAHFMEPRLSEDAKPRLKNVA
jgi:hypothetical protein